MSIPHRKLGERFHPEVNISNRGPTFFVKKKEGTLCPVVDYRELNELTIRNEAPSPLIPELFFVVRGARCFTKIDLRNAYNLIRIREGDKYLTASRLRGVYLNIE